MKRMFFSCLIASLVSGTALADSATTLADNGTGLSTDVYFTSSTITGEIDNDGNKQELNDGNMSIGSMVLNLNTEYQLAALLDGLYLGLDLPLVRTSTSLEGDLLEASEAANPDGDTSWASMGLGDISLYAGYLHELNDNIKLGAQLRFKAATGNDETELNDDMTIKTLPVGSGFHNIQASVLAEIAPIAHLGIAVDAGYIMTLAADKEHQMDGASMTMSVDPGDALFANLKIGYEIAEIVTPRLGIHYFNTGAATSDDTELSETDSNAFGLTFDAAVKITDMIGAYAGLGTSMIGRGTNLPYGYVLAGKNTSTGMGFNLGVTGTF